MSIEQLSVTYVKGWKRERVSITASRIYFSRRRRYDGQWFQGAERPLSGVGERVWFMNNNRTCCFTTVWHGLPFWQGAGVLYYYKRWPLRGATDYTHRQTWRPVLIFIPGRTVQIHPSRRCADWQRRHHGCVNLEWRLQIRPGLNACSVQKRYVRDGKTRLNWYANGDKYVGDGKGCSRLWQVFTFPISNGRPLDNGMIHLLRAGRGNSAGWKATPFIIMPAAA